MSQPYNPYAPPQPGQPNPLPPGGDGSPPGSPQPWAIGEVLELAWERFKPNWLVIMLSVLVAYGLQFLVQAPSSFGKYVLGDRHALFGPWDGAGGLLSTMVSAFFLVGLTRISLTAVRGGTPDLGMLFSGGDRFLPMLGLLLASFVAYVLGLLALVVGVVVVWLGIMLSTFYVVDANLGPIEAMQASWEATRGERLHLLLFGLASVGIFMATAAMCCVPVLVALPVLSLALAIIYTRLSGRGVAR